MVIDDHGREGPIHPKYGCLLGLSISGLFYRIFLIWLLCLSFEAQAQLLKPFPAHWGNPPARQTRDLRELPGGFGRGSGTLARWIAQHLKADAAQAAEVGIAVKIEGALQQWHPVTLSLAGPQASERDTAPNPFTDYRFEVVFRHESGHPTYRVPGYFAGDGIAAETSAEDGNQWRAHLCPDKVGTWHWRTLFLKGRQVALEVIPKAELTPWSGLSGTMEIAPTDKKGKDFRAHGRLSYQGSRYLRFVGSGERFLKLGADAPETFLACVDFDGTVASPTKKIPLKTWRPHLEDWREGDPSWQGGKGKGIIGALNYLSDVGGNAFSFLPYNVGGDGDNIWPFVDRNDKAHYDLSKLDQWNRVFTHANQVGLMLHFKLQENEMDDHRVGHERQAAQVSGALDGGRLGWERKLYCRELVARFSHHLALQWNLGEENTQSFEEQVQMAGYIRSLDPYDHPIVLHTFPDEQEQVYMPLLGWSEGLTGLSLQNHWKSVHQRTRFWVEASQQSGHPWVVANDEQNSAHFGVPPDPGYAGFDGLVVQGNGVTYDLHDIRKYVLWGNLMAGGAGVEYYFGYRLPENDLHAQDWRSRHQSWSYGMRAIGFFQDHVIPLERMHCADEKVDAIEAFCLAQPGACYLVYLPQGGSSRLNLDEDPNHYSLRWFNPRIGGNLAEGSVSLLQGGGWQSLGLPPSDVGEDWLALLRVVEGR